LILAAVVVPWPWHRRENIGFPEVPERVLDGAPDLRELKGLREGLAGMNLVELRGKKRDDGGTERWAQVFNGGADNVAVAPQATILAFLSLEGLEAVKKLVDCLAMILSGDCRREVAGSQQGMVFLHNRIQYFVAICAVACDAPFFGIVRENPFLTEDALNAKAEHSMDEVVE
jgi:hypothetical protein